MKTVDFEKKTGTDVSLLVWSPVRKSRVKALIKLRKLTDFCYEIIKNYKKLSSTISKFQALFQKFELYLSTFWRVFQRNRDMPTRKDWYFIFKMNGLAGQFRLFKTELCVHLRGV